MSINSKKTPNSKPNYLINRVISDLVGTPSACLPSLTDRALIAAYDSLGAVYPLYGIKGSSQQQIGTTVSIGGGYLLAAGHSISEFIEPYKSFGMKTIPRLTIEIGDKETYVPSQSLELQIVCEEVAADLDLALLRVTTLDATQKLKFARLPVLESNEINRALKKSIHDYGRGALFVGCGASHRRGISRQQEKNDITAFIFSHEMSVHTISEIRDCNLNNQKILNSSPDELLKLKHYFLTMGSSIRYPYWNDSGGGLFVLFSGAIFLVGIHTKVLKTGAKNSLSFPVFVNLLSTGPTISRVIEKDRELFLNKDSTD